MLGCICLFTCCFRLCLCVVAVVAIVVVVVVCLFLSCLRKVNILGKIKDPYTKLTRHIPFTLNFSPL